MTLVIEGKKYVIGLEEDLFNWEQYWSVFNVEMTSTCKSTQTDRVDTNQLSLWKGSNWVARSGNFLFLYDFILTFLPLNRTHPQIEHLGMYETVFRTVWFHFQGDLEPN